jgi:putative ABC transport system ATP-binding protein
MSDFIELRDVSKGYLEGGERHEVLRNVTERFASGEIIALLGRSGSGKSTLLNLLAGIDLPDSGDVLVDERVINRMSELERTLFRRRVGFVFQFFNLVPTLTVAENLLLPLELSDGRLTSGHRKRVEDLLERVGLADRRDAFPDRLSGGEQQRIAVVRALIHEPDLLLADEPTGNLDREIGREVLELLRSLCREAGRCLVMATHSREAAEIADRVFQIEDHRLVEVTEFAPS